MAFIGNTQLNQNYVPAVDFFSGNGSTTAFTLSRPVASVAAVQAVISNVPQDPGTAFTVSGNTITFTSAPPSGTNNIYVYYTSPNTQVVQPGQGTVGATQVNGSYALWNKSGSDINYSAGNAGVGTTSPRVKLEVDAAINAPTALATAVTTGANGNFVLADNGGGTVGSQFGIALNGSSYDTYIQARNMGAVSTPYNLLLQPLGGNVGIGTSSPQQKLQVYSSAASGGQIQVTNSSTGAASTDGVLFGYDGSNDVIINNQEATATKFYTSGSERMRIDSSGRVTMPYQPAFSAYGTGGQITGTGVYGVMPFNTAFTNRGNNFNTSTYTFTAPVAGVYMFVTTLAASTANGGPVMRLLINGSIGGIGSIAYSVAYNQATVVDFISLSANDTVAARFETFNGATSSVDMGWCVFSGYLMG